ncbi:MAG: GHKL domain-containing protein [Chromatiaceae bacterium]|nr:MAG: GHKL domain-containing protein [Chromatiaceae bacterium]
MRRLPERAVGSQRAIAVASLQARVLWAAALLLLVFVVLTGLALEQAIRDSAQSARQARLLGQVYLLLAAADSENGRLQLPAVLDEPRFGLPGSGLYAQITDAAGQTVWRSPSAVGLEIPFISGLGPGATRFVRTRDNGDGFLVQGFGVLWSTGPVVRGYSFSVAEDATELQRELGRFRASLARGLGLMSLLLLLALLVLLRWGLRPLRLVAAEVAAIEAGQGRRLGGRYPPELRPLTENLNALLAHGEARQARLDNALGDLAHSLKTPLAVISGASAEAAPAAVLAPVLAEQIARMQQIIAYQLERARAGSPGGAALAAQVPLLPVTQRLAASLAKLHPDQPVELEVAIDPTLRFRGVEGDLMELIGNLLDNAYKWCRGRVHIQATRDATGLQLLVEDDGPGISPDQATRLLERGARADESIPGHGIGLAVVREISQAYGGTLSIDRGRLGGARICICLPA